MIVLLKNEWQMATLQRNHAGRVRSYMSILWTTPGLVEMTMEDALVPSTLVAKKTASPPPQHHSLILPLLWWSVLLPSSLPFFLLLFLSSSIETCFYTVQ